MATLSGLTEEKFLKLRLAVSSRIGSRRFSHTLGVESSIIQLGEMYLPGDVPRLRIAALLHDLTKEWPEERQLSYLADAGVEILPEEEASPRILHAKTGALVAKREFSAYVDPTILRAIELHTTGGSGMTVFDELLYLADYIEPTRTYEECVLLRNGFFEGYKKAEDKLFHLHATVLSALRMTVREISDRGASVFPGTLCAIAYLEELLSKKDKN